MPLTRPAALSSLSRPRSRGLQAVGEFLVWGERRQEIASMAALIAQSPQSMAGGPGRTLDALEDGIAPPSGRAVVQAAARPGGCGPGKVLKDPTRL